MEAIAEHTLEPELSSPPPRRLGLPSRTRLLLGTAALLLGLFAAGSGRALWEGVKLSWLDMAGQTVTGKIVAIRTDAAPKSLAGDAVSGKSAAAQKTPLPVQTAFCYEAALPAPDGPEIRRGWISLAMQSPAAGLESEAAPILPPVRFQIGQPFPVRCASLFGVTVCQPWGPGAGNHIAALFLTGGLVMAVSLLLLRRLGRWAAGRQALLRDGIAVVGTITDKRTEAEDMARFFLRYGYPGGPEIGREEQVSAEQWREFHVGQPVTVLYDPNIPSRAGLYALMKR